MGVGRDLDRLRRLCDWNGGRRVGQAHVRDVVGRDLAAQLGAVVVVLSVLLGLLRNVLLLLLVRSHSLVVVVLGLGALSVLGLGVGLLVASIAVVVVVVVVAVLVVQLAALDQVFDGPVYLLELVTEGIVVAGAFYGGHGECMSLVRS